MDSGTKSTARVCDEFLEAECGMESVEPVRTPKTGEIPTQWQTFCL